MELDDSKSKKPSVRDRIKMLETRQVVRDPNDQAASAELTATATKTPSAEEANGETPGPASANSGSQEPCGDDQTTAQSRTNLPFTSRAGDEENEDWSDAVDDGPPPTAQEEAQRTEQTRGRGYAKVCYKGYGLITASEGARKGEDVFVHYSALYTRAKYKYLVPGEYVEFDWEKTDDGSRHQWKAGNVQGVGGGCLKCEPSEFVARSPHVVHQEESNKQELRRAKQEAETKLQQQSVRQARSATAKAELEELNSKVAKTVTVLKAQAQQANSTRASAQAQKAAAPRVRALSKDDRPIVVSLPLELDGKEVALELHEGETAEECTRLFATTYTLSEQEVEMLTAALKSEAAPKKTVTKISFRKANNGGAAAAAEGGEGGDRVADAVRQSSCTMSEMEKLHMQNAMLKNQIKDAGLKPVEEVTTLEEAKEKLQAVWAKLTEGDESATDDFEKWSVIVDNHPDMIIEKEKEARKWLEQNEGANEQALRLMRSFVPPDIRSCSKAQLEARGVAEKIAKRVVEKRALWFCRMDPVFISKLHAADLCSKFAYQGLDLTEMRAVYASTPETFENDGDGKKKKYRMIMEEKLKELTAKEANGSLTGNDLRNRVYRAHTTGPFDPDAAIVVETVSAGEKMEQKDEWLESNRPSSAGGLAKSGASGESKRAKDTFGEQTSNADGKPPKPRAYFDKARKKYSKFFGKK